MARIGPGKRLPGPFRTRAGRRFIAGSFAVWHKRRKMMVRSPYGRAAGLVSALLLSSAPAMAWQDASPAAPVTQPQPTPTADRLMEQVRLLATNPRNLEALLVAGEASVRLNDPVAAMAFFARADQISPRHPRALAGRASALVAMERPGEAIWLFREAEQRGLSVEAMALDRGMAFDLLGRPDLAQRDYRMVQGGSDGEEATRRLALSHGIAGNLAEATRLIDPLLRKNDRSAWRTWACVLAMNGDPAQAKAIAAGSLPGFGPSLAPFFDRLAALAPADRAHAAHFGQLGMTAERRADLALSPDLKTLTPQPGGAVRLSSLDLVARERPLAVAAANPAPSPVPPSSAEPVPPVSAAARVQPTAPVATAQVQQTLPPVAASPSAPVAVAPVAVAVRPPEPVLPASAPAAAPVSVAQPPVAIAAAQPPIDTTEPLGADRAPAAVAPAAAPAVAMAPEPVDPVAQRAAARAELADIVARLAGDADPNPEPIALPLPSREPPPGARPMVVAAKEAPSATPEKPVAKPAAPKAAAAKPAPAKPDPKKLHPSRIWVQVGVGADESKLPYTWRQLNRTAPDAFKGKQGGYVAAGRTNRLLVGPFASNGQARAFLEAIEKKGLDGFQWTSGAGQQIESLAVK